jgi:hypothetical protein
VVPDSESGSGFREANEETLCSEKLTFSPEDRRLLMELVFIKNVDIDPVLGSGFNQKALIRIRIQWHYPVYYFRMSEYGTTSN